MNRDKHQGTGRRINSVDFKDGLKFATELELLAALFESLVKSPIVRSTALDKKSILSFSAKRSRITSSL